MISVTDEEVGGTGAEWLTAEHPELVRCDYLLNEGGGESLPIDGERGYAVSVGEKGVFRFTLTTDGAAGHASVPDGRRQRPAQARARCSRRWPSGDPAGT